MTTTPQNFSERVEFDLESGEIRDGDARYMMVRADALMGVFKRLDPQQRIDALNAFTASVHEHGGKSAASYTTGPMSDDEVQRLIAVICDTAPRLGWGRWDLRVDSPESLHLRMQNSPFVAGFGSAEHTVCAPVVGMLTAVAELIFGVPCVAQEIDCVACGDSKTADSGVCVFAANVQSA